MSEVSGAKELNNFRIFGGYQKGGEKIVGSCVWCLFESETNIAAAARMTLEKKRKREIERGRCETANGLLMIQVPMRRLFCLRQRAGHVYIQFICSHWICIDS